MQLVARLAATLLAVTWFTPLAQPAPVLRHFTPNDDIGGDPVPGSAPIADDDLRVLGTDHTNFDLRAGQRKTQPETASAGHGLVFQGSYGGVAGLNRPVADVAFPRIVSDADLANVIA